MTIADMIALLQAMPDKSLRIVVNGYEGGYSEVSEARDIELVLNVHSAWYYGPHDRPDQLISEDEEIGRDVVNAILVR